MCRHTFILVSLLAVQGCSSEPEPCAGELTATLMTYNVAGVTGDQATAVARQIDQITPDFLAAQECSNCDELLSQLPADYQLTAAPNAGVALLYDSASWDLEQTGLLLLGTNDDGWGDRVARWARFTEPTTGHCALVYSTHFCVTVRSSEDACNAARQLDYVATITAHIEAHSDPDTAVLIGGDLNVFDGFDQGEVIRALLNTGLVDLYRDGNPTGAGTTFIGNSWAPAGRIDYLFGSPPLTVHEAVVDTDTLNPGEGSDHHPVYATATLGNL